MAFTNGDNFIDEIKSRCNIVDVIGRVVPLKRAGSNYKGVCPFHNEKTPSFIVSETKQRFTCFGCGATGDVISFTERYYNLDFMEAVQKLADEYGIEIKRNRHGSGEKKEKFYEINREAAKFFYTAFRRLPNPGFDYMKKRGIDDDTLKKFGIGYAPDSWDSLYRYMKGKGYDEKTLFDLGLLSKSESGGKYYDKFRNRVMFPIINTNGKVIGFGGRIIGAGDPKYLNSPETPVFMKKYNLYALNLTRQDISKEDCAILVEGYMDVISLYQSGVRNVTASLGTALTENQARLLKRYSENIVLSYDADGAGKKATHRGLDILYREGCRAKALHVTDGKDPDEFVKAKGKEAYLKLVREAKPYADYKLWAAMEGRNLENDEEKMDFLREGEEILKSLKPVEADIYVKKLSKYTGVSESAIRRELNMQAESGGPLSNTGYKSAGKGNYPKESLHEKRITDAYEALPLLPTEKIFLSLVFYKSQYYEKLKDEELKAVSDSEEFKSEEFKSKSLSLFETETAKSIFRALSEIYRPGEDIDLKKLADLLGEDFTKQLEEIEENTRVVSDDEIIFKETLYTVQIRGLKRKNKELQEIFEMEVGEDEEQKKDIFMKEYIENENKIQELKKKLQDLRK
ncbi:MAG: DNA primase [Clostridia bacterium]|nr:DNA primase [Clostridia bacterium]